MKYQGYLDPITHDKLIGWVWDSRNPSAHLPIEVLLDGKPWVSRAAFRFRPDLERAGIGRGDHAFGIDLPPELFDGERHTVRVRVVGGDFELSGSPMVFQSTYDGAIDGVDSQRVWGRMRDLARPNHPLDLEISVDAAMILSARTLPSGEFQVELPKSVDAGARIQVAVTVKGIGIGARNSPIERLAKADLMGGIRSLSGAAKSLDELAPHRDVLQRLFRLVSDESREYFLLPPAPSGVPESVPSASQPIDVVVPVYAGIAQTLRCLESVLASSSEAKFDLTVILDNPDDLVLAAAIEDLRQRRPFHVLKNVSNLGFVSTANRGLALHPDRDVVLLNSDTAVHGNWIDRLRRAAYSAPDIGTATPLSNNATICSYPRFAAANEIPPGLSLAQLDALSERANSGLTIDLPTAVGFCMYVRRDCLASTGQFDEVLFGKGYGEENDFCVRASSLGWRHVLAADVFVEHEGRVSFGAGGEAASHQNYLKLVARWPHYDTEVKQFLARDPVAPARRNIDSMRLGQPQDGALCLASNLLGGGTERHVRETAAESEKRGERVVFLRFQDGDRVSIQLTERPELTNLVYRLPHEFKALVRDLQLLGVQRFHFHQVIGAPLAIFDLPKAMGVPYDCTVHDYAWICPQVNLIDDSRQYCGEPPLSSCEECFERLGPHKDWGSVRQFAPTVAELRGQSSRILCGAATVIAPSKDCASRYKRYVPAASVAARPHDSVAPSPRVPGAAPNETVRVVLIGSIGLSKGFDVLFECARHARIHQLPLEFRVVGGTLDDTALERLGNVIVTGDYVEETVFNLVRGQQGHVAFFPNVWPETFAYTLTIAFRMGLFPVAFKLGAIAERIDGSGFGRLLEPGLAPALINEVLMHEGRRK